MATSPDCWLCSQNRDEAGPACCDPCWCPACDGDGCRECAGLGLVDEDDAARIEHRLSEVDERRWRCWLEEPEVAR